MLRICLNGAGDIKFHYFGLLKINKKKFHEEVNKIAKALVDSNAELVVLPDRGIQFEIAKKYKELGGKLVYGTVPLNDKDFGINHLMPFIREKVKGREVFDRIINTKDWYRQDLTYCLFGDVVLMLGNSLGALGELSYGFYLYKLFANKKPGVSAKKEKIHPAIIAGRHVPFSVIVYKPFMKDKLGYEIEAYIKKVSGKVYYAKNPAEIRKILKKLTQQ